MKLENKYPDKIIERGKEYLSSVKYCIKIKDFIYGKVEGSRTYKTEVDLETLDGNCSCPYGTNCKHAVALYLNYKKGLFSDSVDFIKGLNKMSNNELKELILSKLKENPDWIIKYNIRKNKNTGDFIKSFQKNFSSEIVNEADALLPNFSFQQLLKLHDYIYNNYDNLAEKLEGGSEEDNYREDYLDEEEYDKGLYELNEKLIEIIVKKSLEKNKDKKSDEVIVLEGKLAETRADKDTIGRELGRIEGEISANKRAIEKEESRLKNEESRTVYLRDVEEVLRTVESFGVIEDAKKLFGEVISVLKRFIASHRSNTGSALIGDMDQEVKKLSKERDSLESKLFSLSEIESKYVHGYAELKQMIEKEKDTNRDAEKDVFRIIARQNEVRNVVSNLDTALNSIVHDEEAFKRELGEAGIIAGREAVTFSEVGPHEDSASENARKLQADRRRQIEKIKIRLEDSGAIGGTEVINEYRETEERDTFLARELEDLEKAKKELLALIAELDVRIDIEFKTGILKINTEFQNFFSLMFGGGKAELSVVKEMRHRRKSDMEDLGEALRSDLPEDSVEEGPEGLEVNVSLPRKKVRGLMMLSGGERALTSIALLFAVSQVNPPPFIILDETDAALDEANSKKYGDMIESLSKHSQLILITHNRETMSRAGVIYGVTMGSNGVSKLLSISFDEAVEVAK